MGKTIDSLMKKHSNLIDAIDETRSRLENEIEALKTQHDSDLGKNRLCKGTFTVRMLTQYYDFSVILTDTLDAEVKGEVSRKEDELSLLRDAVETEKVKMAKLEKMQKRYESG